MKAISTDEMKRADLYSIKEKGIPSLKLMENAGKCVVNLINKIKLIQGQIIILVGPGNNGGDGLVVSRLLNKQGIGHKILYFFPIEKCSPDFKTNWKRLPSNIDIHCLHSSKDVSKHLNSLKQNDLIIDAIFGTGLKRNIRGTIKSVITKVNASSANVLSIDTPSGLDTNTGRIMGACIKASYTISFGYPKIGFFVADGPDFCGLIHVADIGLSRECESDFKTDIHLALPAQIQHLIKKRPQQSHKGSYGHVYTIGTNKGMPGAGLLCAHGALRSGSGLSTLILPDVTFKRINIKDAPIIFKPILTKRNFFEKEHFEIIQKTLIDASVVAIGPGIGRESSTLALVRLIAQHIQRPVVIDADALSAFPNRSLLINRKFPTILTPHPKEMAKLMGTTTPAIQKNRYKVARNFAIKQKIYLILKGARTLLVTPEGKIWINLTGHPVMASAGQGDVLTGMCAGFVSEGFFLGRTVEESLLLAIFIHGLCASLLEKKGYSAVTAVDTLNMIQEAMCSIKKQNKKASLFINEF